MNSNQRKGEYKENQHVLKEYRAVLQLRRIKEAVMKSDMQT